MYPLGHSINGSPHSVCVSLPTMSDIRGYEERAPAVMQKLTVGYPRFFRGELISRLVDLLEREYDLRGRLLFLAASEHSARRLLRYTGGSAMPFRGGGFHGVQVWHEDAEALLRAKTYLQHTGCGISSREAEGALGLDAFQEDLMEEAPDARIRSQLCELYKAAAPEDIFLSRGGMNGFYGGFSILRDIQAAKGRIHWIQLGWLYVDTLRILEKMLPPGGHLHRQYDVFDIDGLSNLLKQLRGKVAGIVTEVPTNPLVQTCDVEALSELCRRHGAALILDPTISSPHNVNILPYSDLHVNSLTKYACNQGDVMVGAVGLNRASPFYEELKAALPKAIEHPSVRDLGRLAFEMQSYGDTVTQMNANTRQVAAFLEGHPAVDQVWWAERSESAANYARIRHLDGGPGCMITFTLKVPLEAFYDRVNLVKSPSFGTAFTMLCPFMYLAHYDLVTTAEGRRELQQAGLPADLIRLSVGTEPAAEIINALDSALTAASRG